MLENFKIHFLTFHLTLYIYIYIYIIFYTITFKNLINDATSHLTHLLWKSLASKYIIIVKNVINEIMKKSDKTN